MYHVTFSPAQTPLRHRPVPPPGPRPALPVTHLGSKTQRAELEISPTVTLRDESGWYFAADCGEKHQHSILEAWLGLIQNLGVHHSTRSTSSIDFAFDPMLDMNFLGSLANHQSLAGDTDVQVL